MVYRMRARACRTYHARNCVCGSSEGYAVCSDLLLSYFLEIYAGRLIKAVEGLFNTCKKESEEG